MSCLSSGFGRRCSALCAGVPSRVCWSTAGVPTAIHPTNYCVWLYLSWDKHGRPVSQQLTDCSTSLSLSLSPPSIAAACWILHYAKRLLETLFVHRFSHATMPLRNLFKVNWGNRALACSLCSPNRTAAITGDLLPLSPISSTTLCTTLPVSECVHSSSLPHTTPPQVLVMLR